MASSHQHIEHDDMVQGMSALPPHLIPKHKWSDAYGMEFYLARAQQFSRKVRVTTLQQGTQYNIQNLVALPTGVRDNAILVALTERNAFRIDYSNDWTALPGVTPFQNGVLPEKWGTVVYGSKLYFTNLANPVLFCDGSQVLQHIEEDQPAARYLGVFYDHLIAGHVRVGGNIRPDRFMWSNLNEFGVWRGTRKNEADHYDCLEASRTDAKVKGITGIGPLVDMFAVYTPEVIYLVRYVGLPTIMRTDPLFRCGPDLIYSLAVTDSAHYYPNTRNRNFYMFNGQAHTEVGDEIANRFFDDLHPVEELRQRTWAYIDTTKQNIHWCYASKANGTGTLDHQVVYNYRSKDWSWGPCEDLHSFCLSAKTFKTISHYAGQGLDSLSPLAIVNMSPVAKRFSRLYGSGHGVLLRDAVYIGNVNVDDPPNLYVKQDLPFLVTGDIDYSDTKAVKEVDSILLHAIAQSGGVTVSYAVRQFYSDPFPGWTTFGTWTSTVKEGRLTSKRFAGKIVRFMFQPVASAGPYTVFTSDNVP